MYKMCIRCCDEWVHCCLVIVLCKGKQTPSLCVWPYRSHTQRYGEPQIRQIISFCNISLDNRALLQKPSSSPVFIQTRRTGALRWLVARPRKSVFGRSPSHVQLWCVEVTLGETSLWVLASLPARVIQPMIHTHLFITDFI